MSLITLKTALLAAALHLQPSQPGESQVQYRDRVRNIVEAIAEEIPRDVGLQKKLAFTVLVIWHQESRFDRIIHAGGIHPRWDQDNGRARCAGQIHASRLVPRDEWERLTGTDLESTRRCAAATIRVIRANAVCAKRAPKEQLAAVLAGYASGSSCRPTKQSRKRASMVERLLARF